MQPNEISDRGCRQQRLCGEAAGGQILISGRVLGVVEEFVQTEALGDLILKGFHRAVDAYNVLGLRAAGSTPSNQSIGQPVADA